MNDDSVKYVGKFKEQIDMEFKAHRNYPRKWSKFVTGTPWDDMYDPNNLSKQLKEQSKSKDIYPFQHTNEGDGHFISPDMYKSLLAQCRCGRPHGDLHLLRCLQKAKTQYDIPKEDSGLKSEEEKREGNIPKTSSGFVGWQKVAPRYKQWEESIRYKSPVYDMPGERITSTPYNAIIIG